MGWNWETLCREMVRHANSQAIGGPHSCPRHDSPEQGGQAQNRQVDSHRLDNKIGAGHGLPTMLRAAGASTLPIWQVNMCGVF